MISFYQATLVNKEPLILRFKNDKGRKRGPLASQRTHAAKQVVKRVEGKCATNIF